MEVFVPAQTLRKRELQRNREQETMKEGDKDGSSSRRQWRTEGGRKGNE